MYFFNKKVKNLCLKLNREVNKFNFWCILQTNKEKEIIKCMALMGASDKEISEAGKKVGNTINRHRKNYFSKSKKKSVYIYQANYMNL